MPTAELKLVGVPYLVLGPYEKFERCIPWWLEKRVYVRSLGFG